MPLGPSQSLLLLRTQLGDFQIQTALSGTDVYPILLEGAVF